MLENWCGLYQFVLAQGWKTSCCGFYTEFRNFGNPFYQDMELQAKIRNPKSVKELSSEYKSSDYSALAAVAWCIVKESRIEESKHKQGKGKKVKSSEDKRKLFSHTPSKHKG